jgi:Cu+-exporting ATPase
MTIEPENAVARNTYRGRTYYFCGAGCHERFLANPDAYAKQGPSVAAPMARPPVSGGVVFTCPIHLEVPMSGYETAG